MTFETKEEVLEKILADEKPKCPHCQSEMSLWEVPPFTFSDGLGWGAPYLFICFNDECPPYVRGWDNLMENYAQRASVRCMCYPGKNKFEFMPVFSAVGARGQIIDEQALMEQELIKERIKKGFSILTDAYVATDSVTVIRLLLDASEPQRVRMKAAEMIGDIGGLEALEPITNSKFGNKIVQQKVTESIAKIHERHFTRECPFCAETIKKRAKICKHCHMEVAGK
jgi:hypothetical protein